VRISSNAKRRSASTDSSARDAKSSRDLMGSLVSSCVLAGTLVGAGSCFVDYELGDAQLGESLVYEGGPGVVVVTRVEATLGELHFRGEGPDGLFEVDQPGPWIFDVLDPEQGERPPVITLGPGDWISMEASCVLQPVSGTEAFYLEGRYLPDDGGEALDFRFLVQTSFPLSVERNGTTKYATARAVDVAAGLHPDFWFPNVNMSNLDADAAGWLTLSPTQNAVAYGQMVDALDRSTRAWLEP